SIGKQEKDESIVKSAVEEARAVFDPVINANFTHAYNQSFDRKRIGRVFHRRTVNVGGQNLLIFDAEAQEATQIESLVFANPRPDFYRREQVDASSENPTGPAADETFDITFEQQLPWGHSITFGGTSIRHQTFDELMGEFGAPWITNLQASFVIPIPFSKDWGSYAPAETGIKVANLNRERAFWDTKTVINNTIVTIDHAFWNLAAAAENLRAASENRKSVETILADLKKMVEAGRATDYGNQQVEAELAAVREVEEGAWGAYLQASNFLVNLLDHDKKTVFIPAGYTRLIEEHMALNTKEANQIAIENRPELKAARVSAKVSAVLVRFQQNQTKPDLKVSGTYQHKQLNFKFGYQDWWDSIRALPNQDARVQTYQFDFSRAVFNRTVYGNANAARAGEAQANVTVEATVNQIEQDVGDALVSLLSRKRQVELAAENLRLARETLKQAKEFYTGGRLTEFEIVTHNRTVLLADLSLVAASAAYKSAESQLLFAQGVLPYQYASMTAPNSLEQRRIGVLTQANALRFFGGGPKTEAAPAKPEAAPAK
ncbi:MAG: TolC family protein, partial [Planctomycetota bacterium]|nr:TolC family protein [Planctomycetota bacterium]